MRKINLPPLLKEDKQKQFTVGGNGADLVGFEGKTVQIALDALKGCGGRILLTPGTFTVSAPLRLYDGIELVGAGEQTVLKKNTIFTSPLLRDADYGELVLTVEHPEGFSIGDGIVVYDNPNKYAWGPTTARITDIRGNQIFIDEYLVRDYNAEQGGCVSNASSLIEGVGVSHVTVRNLTLDGTACITESLSGCRGGAVYFHRAKDVLVSSVTVKNFGGEGISVQTMEGVTIEECDVSGCLGNGIHPGTGSYGVRVERCYSHENKGDGLFVCWRVIGGLFQNNRFEGNEGSGINIGHKDTDNLFENNSVIGNGRYGLHLRKEREDNAPHRCIYRNNRFEDNKKGAVQIDSPAQDLLFENNIGY